MAAGRRQLQRLRRYLLAEDGSSGDADADAAQGERPAAVSVQRRLVMPMRLPTARPAKVAAKWPADTLGEEQAQLGVRFDFFGARLPPGSIESCVAGCGALPGCKLLECW